MDILTLVLAALLWVETSNGTNVRPGDNGRAIGPYQMWRVAVDEANRIERMYADKYGRTPRTWRYSDRKDPVKSREMCEVTLIWHYQRGHRDPVELACRWRNPYSRTQVAYKQKVRRAIRRIL